MERKIFILVIFAFQTFKSWVSCVCDRRLRRSTVRRVLRCFPRAPQILQRTRIADAMALRAPRCRLCAFAGACAAPAPRESAGRFTPVVLEKGFAGFSTSRTILHAANTVNHRSSEASTTIYLQPQAKRTWNLLLRHRRFGTSPFLVSVRSTKALKGRPEYSRG